LRVIIKPEKVLKRFVFTQIAPVLKEQARSLSEHQTHPGIKFLNAVSEKLSAGQRIDLPIPP
jgi:hypothetical protein